MYPAGFTPHDGGQVASASRDEVPLISVGALNPDLRTIALFSNEGDWVTCHRQGAALVSTMPTTFNGSLQPLAKVRIPGLGVRQNIDPDNFHGGFATWSGTSFSAPILAGQAAQLYWESGTLDSYDPATAVERAWTAIEELTQLTRPGDDTPDA
jgi:subtilisin family serine protease